MKIYKSEKGYFYKIYKNGKRKRISLKDYNKLLKQLSKKKTLEYKENKIIKGGGASIGSIYISLAINKQKLMNSYKVCDPSINNDILSQLRCGYNSNKINLYKHICPKDLRCFMSRGVFQDPWLKQLYDITEHLFGPSDFTGWFEFGKYLNSGNHYLVSLSTPLHGFLLEFKNSQFRILSSWEGFNSFLDFPSISKWGNFDGHPDWNEFTRLMTILNGGPLLNQDDTKIIELPSDDSTWNWTDDELRNSGEIYRELFSVEVNMHFFIDRKKELEPHWRKEKTSFIAYPKGKAIDQLRVFIQLKKK